MSRTHSRDRIRSRRRTAPILEIDRLEPRCLLAITPAVFDPIGPTPQALKEHILVPGNVSTGAIQAVVASPTDANVVYVGAVNGGIWKTVNATAAVPTWTPVFDDAPSLSILSLVMDPLDSTGNTLYAGTGRLSSFGFRGTGGVGLYKTSDGGQSWSQLGASTFQGKDISGIVSRPSGLFVGASDGVYRSTDGGASWTNTTSTSTAPIGSRVNDLVERPGDPGVLFAASPRQGERVSGQIQVSPGGIYASADGGNSWGLRSNGLPDLDRVVRIRLATHRSNQGASERFVLYAALGYERAFGVPEASRGELTRVFRSEDEGRNWVEMDIPGKDREGTNPGGQQELHLALVADDVNPNVVYIAGDRLADYAEGGVPANGFRGDASAPEGTQWTNITREGANGTAPHPDVRNMALDANGNLLLVGDGGIARLTSPGNAATRTWTALPGNLQTTEFVSIGYDSLNQIVLGGLQDNGTALEVAAGGLAYRDVTSGDGAIVAVDTLSFSNASILYVSAQRLGGFKRLIVGDSNKMLGEESIGLRVGGPDGPRLDTLGQIGFYQPFAINSQNPSRLLFSNEAGVLFESFDRGDTLTRLTSEALGELTAVVAGGRADGQAVPNLAWIGTQGNSGGQRLFLRAPGSAEFAPLTAYRGTVPNAIAVDPYNWRNAWILDTLGAIHATSNGGASFTKMSIGFPQNTTPVENGALVVIPNPKTQRVDALIVGTTNGIWATDTPRGGQFANWTRFDNLPRVHITGLAYDALDNVLVAGTLGRGSWIARGVSNSLGRQAPALDANGAADGIDFATTFAAGGPGVAAVSGELSLLDQDTPNLAAALVQLTGRKDGASEILAVDATGTNIAPSFDAASGRLILSGMDSVQNYQKVLRTLTYRDTAQNPILGARVLKIRVNDGADNSLLAKSVVTLTAAEEIPVIDLDPTEAGMEEQATFDEGQPPSALAPRLTIRDKDSPTMTSAVAAFVEPPPDGEQEALSVDISGTSIQATYRPVDGVLQLSGVDTVANYEKVLRTLTYSHAGDNPTPGIRQIGVHAVDAQNQGLGSILEVEVLPENDSPILPTDRSYVLRTVQQGEENEGTPLVETLFGGDGLPDFQDRDGDEFGVAITGASSPNGKWQYRLEGFGEEENQGEGGGEGEEESPWFDLDDASPDFAVLLPAIDGVDLRFVPNPGFSGIDRSLRFRLWDLSAANPFAAPEALALRINATQVGGATGLSEAESMFQVFVREADIPPPPIPPAVAGVVANGRPGASTFGLLQVTLSGDVNAAVAGNPASYLVTTGRRVVPVRSVIQDAAGRVVTLVLARPLHFGQAVRVAFAGTALELLTGKSLQFRDIDGDLVRIGIKGRGLLGVQRALDGSVREVRLFSPPGARPLVGGRVLRNRRGGDGTVRLGRLVDFDNAVGRLPGGPLGLQAGTLAANSTVTGPLRGRWHHRG